MLEDMSTFVRASKFRHVYCDPPRLDATYQNLRLSTATGEQNYIKANGLFLATGLSVSNPQFNKILVCIIIVNLDLQGTFYNLRVVEVHLLSYPLINLAN